MKNIYYVYCLLDPTKITDISFGDITFEYEPFYIGKGCKNRINQHFSDAQLKRDKNKSKVNKIYKIRNLGCEPIGYKIYENLNETDALEKEKNLITLIGRKDLKNGTLTNLTSGGENYVHWNELNVETQNKMRKATSDYMTNNNPMKNKEVSKKVADKNRNIKHDDIYKKNMSDSLKNSLKHKKSTSTSEFRETKRKEQIKNMKAIIQYDNNMNYLNEYESITEASKKLNIRKVDISSTLHKRQKTTKGYIFKFKNNENL